MIKSGENFDNLGFPAFYHFRSNFLQTRSFVISGFQLLFDLADFQLPFFSRHYITLPDQYYGYDGIDYADHTVFLLPLGDHNFLEMHSSLYLRLCQSH